MLLDLASGLPNPCKVVLLADGPFSERLRSKGIEVEIIPLNVQIAKKDSWLGSPLKIIRSLSVARQIAKVAAKFDIMYANTPKAFVLGGIASIIARKPLVYHLHDILSTTHFSKLNVGLLVGFANRLTRLVIANSQATLEAFVEAGGDRSRVRVIPNGFDPAPFDVDRSSKRQSIREHLKVPLDVKLVIIPGRIARWKGQDVLLEALKELPEWFCLIVGDALFTEDDQQYKKELLQTANESSLKDRVHFLGFRDDMLDLYAAADLVVHCSTAPEPFGRVVVEGILSRKIVIAMNTGGSREILAPIGSRLLVNPNSPHDLAKAIQSLSCLDTGEQKKFIESIRVELLNKYSLERVLENTSIALESIATTR